MTTRRSFLGVLGGLAPLWRGRSAQEPRIEVRPTALYSQPDGRSNLVRVTVAGLDAPAARARLTDRRGALVGTAGLLPATDGLTFQGEVWVPLSEPATFDVEVEVGRRRVARARARLSPPRRWTLYLLSTMHTDVGYTDLQERALAVHHRNLDAALARLATNPDYRWTAECALQVLTYVEQRSREDGDALVAAIREGKVGFQALYANMLSGLLDHETFARLVWPAGVFARDRGIGFQAAQLTDVPGAPATFPSLLAASGVRYLASGVNPERALPLFPVDEARRAGGEGTVYPQLHWWEGPDGARVLHWRAHHYGDVVKLGAADGPDMMARRLSDWLLDHPVLVSPAYPYDVALLYGVDLMDNAPMREAIVANIAAFGTRYAFPRLVPGRAEDFFRDVERRWGRSLPVVRGDSGTYWEDGAAAAARELALFRAAQLEARAADVLALWDEVADGIDPAAVERARRRAEERRRLWEDLLLFGEHTWGADVSVSAPDSRQTIAQWSQKRRYLEGGWSAARGQVADALVRIGRRTEAGLGRLVFNASSWSRTDVVRVPGGAGMALRADGRELPSVDVDGDALVVARDVPALGYVALTAAPRAPRPIVVEGSALEAAAGGHRVRLDPMTGAIASLTGPDGAELVRPGTWSGLNQPVYARGGDRSAMWTSGDRTTLTTPPVLAVAQAELPTGTARFERLPGIGVRLVAARRVAGLDDFVSTITLYDELPWLDIENRWTKPERLDKEALYVAFPFAFTAPDVDVETPLGRMRVERDQQPGACRDWFCHTHWVSLTEGQRGVLWSGPDTPLFTLNDIVRGVWRRRIAPDGTLFAWALHNYWHTNYPARQGGTFTHRFRLSLLAPSDPAEPVRRGWAACDPLRVSAPYDNAGPGRLLARDRALVCGDAGVCVVGAKPADDGEGVVVKLLDVVGRGRQVNVWPAAYRFKLARRCNLVEMNSDALTVAGDGRAQIDVPAWGPAAARLFTPREQAG